MIMQAKNYRVSILIEFESSDDHTWCCCVNMKKFEIFIVVIK